MSSKKIQDTFKKLIASSRHRRLIVTQSEGKKVKIHSRPNFIEIDGVVYQLVPKNSKGPQQPQTGDLHGKNPRNYNRSNSPQRPSSHPREGSPPRGAQFRKEPDNLPAEWDNWENWDNWTDWDNWGNWDNWGDWTQWDDWDNWSN